VVCFYYKKWCLWRIDLHCIHKAHGSHKLGRDLGRAEGIMVNKYLNFLFTGIFFQEVFHWLSS
jgi:hypothetical protein